MFTTAITIVRLKVGLSAQEIEADETHKEAIKLLQSFPACNRNFAYGTLTEDPTILIWMNEFKFPGAAQIFTSAPEHGQIIHSLRTIAKDEQAEVLRRTFQLPISFEKLLTRRNPILEVLVYKLKAGVSVEEWRKAGENLENWFKATNIARVTQAANENDDERICVSLIAWESIEAHQEAVKNPEFAKARESSLAVRGETLLKGHLDPIWA